MSALDYVIRRHDVDVIGYVVCRVVFDCPFIVIVIGR